MSDYVIIGAGSAGCVLANRLSADGRHSVTLLEAGGSDASPLVRVPIGLLWVMHSPKFNWRFRTAPQADLYDRTITYPRGKVLGGSSSINGMTAIRGQKEDFDNWRALGCEGWDFANVLPYFKKLETFPGGEDAFHGGSGPIHLSDVSFRPPVADAWIAACVEAGIPHTTDFNGARQEGAGYYQNNTRRGLRSSASVGYLHPARGRKNLTVVTGAHVARIGLDGDRATSVDYVKDGARQTVRAAKEILLCAGTIQSPQILMLSGIGPEAELKRHGIAVAHRLEGVGRNLQDHLDIPIIFAVKHGTSLYGKLSPPGIARYALQYSLFRTGPFATVTSPVGVFTRSAPAIPTPDLQYHVGLMGYLQHGEVKLKRDAITAAACPLRPTSRGEIRLKDADPLSAPVIDPCYLSTEADRRTMLDAIAVTRNIAAQKPLKPFYVDELYPGPARKTGEELLEFVRREADTCYHPCGTCAMGPANDDATVVLPDLTVKGLRGLRVIDASVMPRLVSGNTNLPAMMIAERAADLIKGTAP